MFRDLPRRQISVTAARLPTSTTTYVIDFGDRWSEELARAGLGVATLRPKDLPLELPQTSQLLIFLPRPSQKSEELLQRCLQLARRTAECRVCLIGSYRTHLGDRSSRDFEELWLRRFQAVVGRKCMLLRTGTIIRSRPTTWQCLAAPFYPLLPTSWRSCYVSFAEVLSTARDSITSSNRRLSSQTLLGLHRTVAETWREMVSQNLVARAMVVFAKVLSVLCIGPLSAWCVAGLRRLLPNAATPFQGTLEPKSVAELLSLTQSANRSNIILAGYNTGVVHFGWKFPGKTVVKTIGCGRRIRVRDDYVDVDAGVTLKRLIGELARNGRELYAVPNYSYVSIGTAYFVPIHGSGHVVATLGDTIEKVLAYDMCVGRFVVLRRGTAAFAESMYAPDSNLLALRLRLRTRPQTRYFMIRSELNSPDAAAVWSSFGDENASNIELRKSSAGATAVQVAKFYGSASAGGADVMEVPRDSIGRIWDRLEENRVTSYLFHALTRRFAFHVELFLDRHEFETFWQSHRELPLLKLQLRFARRDDIPCSPIGSRDCVAIDLFMRRSASTTFLKFMQEQLPHARFNRGKHSM
ncbi:MAG: hypothetical protein C0483_17270 [Pirellula sp.]|nr:hypothetical protein [Pirellula sp.]